MFGKLCFVCARAFVLRRADNTFARRMRSSEKDVTSACCHGAVGAACGGAGGSRTIVGSIDDRAMLRAEGVLVFFAPSVARVGSSALTTFGHRRASHRTRRRYSSAVAGGPSVLQSGSPTTASARLCIRSSSSSSSSSSSLSSYFSRAAAGASAPRRSFFDGSRSRRRRGLVLSIASFCLPSFYQPSSLGWEILAWS